jgi:hypothetical protein
MQVLDLKAAAGQQPVRVAVAEVKLHQLIAGLVRPAHAEVGSRQPLVGAAAGMVEY